LRSALAPGQFLHSVLLVHRILIHSEKARTQSLPGLPSDSKDNRMGNRVVLAVGSRQVSHSGPLVNGDPNLTKEKLLMFLDRLGASARSPGACFITGGGSALLLGWRETTIDIVG